MATGFDDFGTSSNWTANRDATGSTWTHASGELTVSLNSIEGLTLNAIDSDANRDNIQLLFKIEALASLATISQYVGICRGSSGGSGPYRYAVRMGGGNFRIYKYVNSTTPTQVVTINTSNFNATGAYWVRFDVQSTTVRARIWKDGTSEPTTWSENNTDNAAISATDSSITGVGWAGVQSTATYSGNIKWLNGMGYGTNGDTAPASAGSSDGTATSATVTATSSATGGAATGDAVAAGATVSVTCSATGTSATGSAASSAATVAATCSAVAGSAAGDAQRAGDTVAVTSSAQAGTVAADAAVGAATVTVTASAIAGAASGSAGGTAASATVVAAASALNGAATGEAVASAATVSATASAASGAAQVDQAAASATVTAAASTIAGSASGASGSTVPGATVTAAASFIAGALETSSFASAAVVTVVANAIAGATFEASAERFIDPRYHLTYIGGRTVSGRARSFGV